MRDFVVIHGTRLVGLVVVKYEQWYILEGV